MLEENELKDLILKYYYTNKELEKNILYDKIDISIGKNKFHYKFDIDKIYNDLQLNTIEEENIDFNNLVIYLNKELNCNLFIFQRI